MYATMGVSPLRGIRYGALSSEYLCFSLYIVVSLVARNQRSTWRDV